MRDRESMARRPCVSPPATLRTAGNLSGPGEGRKIETRRIYDQKEKKRFVYCSSIITLYESKLLYVQEVVTRPKILNRTILSN